MDELLRTIHISILCNESEVAEVEGRQVINGSPTENALVHMAIASGVDVGEVRSKYPRQEIRYRSESRLYMSTFHLGGQNGGFVAMKGSPFEVLSKCDYHVRDGAKHFLSEDDRAWVEAQNAEFGRRRCKGAGGGLRSAGKETRKHLRWRWCGWD